MCRDVSVCVGVGVGVGVGVSVGVAEWEHPMKVKDKLWRGVLAGKIPPSRLWQRCSIDG